MITLGLLGTFLTVSVAVNGASISLDRRQLPGESPSTYAGLPLLLGGNSGSGTITDATAITALRRDTVAGAFEHNSTTDSTASGVEAQGQLLLRGPVERILAEPLVAAAVLQLMGHIGAALPSHQSVLEYVVDPDGNDGHSFLMLSVRLAENDELAWAAVEKLIDDHWLSLAPEVRKVLGVGRELVSVG